MRPSTENRPFHAVMEKSGLPFIALLISLTLLAGLFLFPSPWEFPMDDTYIHFVYAQNLAKYGHLFFNQPEEIGVGSTSLTWVVLLATAVRLSIPLHLAAKTLGLLSLIGCAWGLYLLLLPIIGYRPALALSLLVAASGHMLWFALSGMETVLFLSLGILSLLLYRGKCWIGLGFSLGVLALTRPDGLALAAAIGLVEVWSHRKNLRRLPSGLFVAGLVCLLVAGPWFGYLLVRTGHLLPTSAIGKQTSSLLGIQLVISRSPSLSLLAHFPFPLYFGAWVVYVLMFVLGGMSLPGPSIPIGSEIGNANYSISLLGMVGWAIIILPLLGSFAYGWLKAYRDKAFNGPAIQPLQVLAVWIILHNLAYAFFLPIPGTASRYGVVNHLALWLALMLGLLRFIPHPGLFRILSSGLVIIAITNTLYWNRVYDANLEHMLNVRIAAAHYLTQTVPPSQVLAAFDVGAVRYYSDRPVIDLGGLIDPALGEVYRADGRIDRYLYEHNVRHLALPGQSGSTAEGWFDFAREMGLTDSALFSLEQVKVFAINYERWLLGYLPTNNYQATVTIYQLR